MRATVVTIASVVVMLVCLALIIGEPANGSFFESHIVLFLLMKMASVGAFYGCVQLIRYVNSDKK